MLIKFKDTDPRAGQVARMDSSRGQQLIDTGAAEQVTENGEPMQAAVDPVLEQPADTGAAEQVVDAAPKKAAKGKK